MPEDIHEQNQSLTVSPDPIEVWHRDFTHRPTDAEFWAALSNALMKSKDPSMFVGLVRSEVLRRDRSERVAGLGKMFSAWERARRRREPLVQLYRPAVLTSMTGVINFTNKNFALRMGAQFGAIYLVSGKVALDDIIGFGVVTSGVAVACLPEDMNHNLRIDDIAKASDDEDLGADTMLLREDSANGL